MKKNLMIIILVLVVAGGGYFAYTSFFSGNADGSAGDGFVSSDGGDAGVKLIALLDKLQKIKLSDAIFASPQFVSLRDETTQVVNEPVGRSNPFAPIGRDYGFVPSADLITSAPTSTVPKTTLKTPSSNAVVVTSASTTKKTR